MNVIFNNVKLVRKALGLSQEAFGKPLGMSRDAIGNIEYGRVPNIEQSRITAICAIYGVNEEWLKTGKGDMFIKPAETFVDELAEKYGIDDFLKRAITTYMSLSEAEKDAVKKFIDQLSPPPDDDTGEIFKVACSTDNHPPEIRKLTKAERERIESAEPVTSETDDF